MRELRLEEFDCFYKILEKSFHKSEIRPYEELKKLYLNKEVIIYGYGETKLLGGIIVWELDTCLFLDSCAIDEPYRNKGIGTSFLQAIPKIYKNKIIVLEVDKPSSAIDERRIELYKRNGFVLHKYEYIQPVLNGEPVTTPYLIMSYGNTVNDSNYPAIKKEIFEKVYHVKE